MKRTSILLCLTLALGLTTAVSAREPKTRSKNGAWSGSNGGSGTWKKDTTRGNGERTTESTATNAQGETATRRTRMKKTGEGTASYEGESTGFKGRSINTEGTVSKTETGRVNEGTYTTGNGGSGNYRRTVDKTETGRTYNTTATNDKGKTVQSTTDVTRDGNTVTATQTQTNAQGKSRTRTGTATVNK